MDKEIKSYLKQSLTSVYSTLNEVEVKGEKNTMYIYSCLSKLKEVFQTIEQQEEGE